MGKFLVILRAVASGGIEAVEQMRKTGVTLQLGVEEIRRLFGISLMIEHWADAVRGLSGTLAEAR